MRLRAALAVMACTCAVSACNKWIGMSTEKAPRNVADGNPTVRPDTSSDRPESLEKGHMRVTVKLIKGENQAWFKNCLSFRVTGEINEEKRVGCNKRQPGQTFLEQETPYDFEVTKGGMVNLSFNFETWFSTSNCITYAQCTNPYPGAPAVRSITGPVPAIRCYRAGTQAFRLFYEDQPDDNHVVDARVRSKLLMPNENRSPAPFDPSAPVDLATRYRKKSGVFLDTAHPLEACVAQKSTGDFVTEQTLQDCLGIDHRDFVVEVESADASIRIGDFTDDRCKPL